MPDVFTELFVGFLRCGVRNTLMPVPSPIIRQRNPEQDQCAQQTGAPTSAHVKRRPRRLDPSGKIVSHFRPDSLQCGVIHKVICEWVQAYATQDLHAPSVLRLTERNEPLYQGREVFVTSKERTKRRLQTGLDETSARQAEEGDQPCCRVTTLAAARRTLDICLQEVGNDLPPNPLPAMT